MNIHSYRNLFPITENKVYLSNSASTPASTRQVDAMARFFQDWAMQGRECVDYYMDQAEEARGTVADLIGADCEEVAFVSNTSMGLNAVAQGLKLGPGDAVLVPVPDFPANVFAWKNLEQDGVRIVEVPKREDGRFGVEELEKSLVPGARVVALSSVDFVTGFAADLKAIGSFCREKGLLFCVDAIQGLGVLPLDVRECGIHFLSSGTYKWLLGQRGAALLYVSEEADHLVSLPWAGWRTMAVDGWELHFSPKKGARRLEPGSLDIMGALAAKAGLDIIAEAGMAGIHTRIMDLTDMVKAELDSRSLEVVSPWGPGNVPALFPFLWTIRTRSCGILPHARFTAPPGWVWCASRRTSTTTRPTSRRSSMPWTGRCNGRGTKTVIIIE
ncbi:aminotransferase class V-fold PLP-dependent enzyme [Salidesulfovibrio onnuriiensis]|uniref:aminotransferase class V-fold PLP-dependent enzyme n=1 Tax=Salidesulfovibrio onnuriiensis TaxID=2583823 RepID=UPI0011C753F7|nr:aminotransferase class V-fold PLP-dependent enzyme [Salidesulfovibrio onnuriiensis]